MQSCAARKSHHASIASCAVRVIRTDPRVRARDEVDVPLVGYFLPGRRYASADVAMAVCLSLFVCLSQRDG